MAERRPPQSIGTQAEITAKPRSENTHRALTKPPIPPRSPRKYRPGPQIRQLRLLQSHTKATASPIPKGLASASPKHVLPAPAPALANTASPKSRRFADQKRPMPPRIRHAQQARAQERLVNRRAT